MDHLNLQAVRAAYLRHLKAGGEPAILPPADQSTGKSKLYAGDLGGCHRKAILRATGAKKRKKPDEAEDAAQIDFFIGDQIHDLTYYALEWAGLLACHERRLDFPEPFGGRLDCIYYDPIMDKLVLWDGKTVKQNQLTDYAYQLPKAKDIAQLSAYTDRLEHNEYDLIAVEYIGKGTRLPPQLFFVANSGAGEEIAQFIEEYKRLPKLPPKMEPTVRLNPKRPKQRKAESDEAFAARRAKEEREISTISYGYHWECDGWCDYAWESCQPLGEDAVTVWDHKVAGNWTDGGKRLRTQVEAALSDVALAALCTGV